MRAIDFVQAIWATGVSGGLARFRSEAVRVGGVVVTFGADDTIRVRHAYAYDAERRNLPKLAARVGVEQRYWQALEFTESKDITLPADATLADLHSAIAEVVAYRCARVIHIPDGSVEAFDTETGAMVGQWWEERA